MKFIKLLIIFCLLSTGLWAQNDVQFTHYMFNKLGYNPAFAGANEALTIGAIFREQWVNVEGAPQTLRAHAHTPFFKNRSGIGLAVTTDKIGLFQTNSVDLSYAYRMPLGKNTLSIGLSGRIEQGNADWNKAQGIDNIDNSLPVGEQSLLAPNFGAGATLTGDQFYVGVSVPQLLNNSNFQYSDLPGEEDISMRTMYLMGGADFSLTQNVKLMPSALVSYNPNSPVDLDATLGLMFMNSLYTGVNYRLGDSFDFIAMYQLTQQFRLGAAYDFTTSAISDKTPGSFEIMAGYIFDYNTDDIKNIRFF